MRRRSSIRLIYLIGNLDFRMTWRDRSVAIWILLMPLAFMFVFGQIRFGGSSGAPRATLTIEDNDGGPLSAGLIEALRHENIHIVDSLAAGHEAVRTLVIPEGFSRDVFYRRRVELLLRKDEGTNSEAAEAVTVAIFRGLIKTVGAQIELESSLLNDHPEFFSIADDTISGSLQTVMDNVPGSRESIGSMIDTVLSRPPTVAVVSERAGMAREIPSGYQSSVPGNLVMFVLMGMVFAGMAVTEERASGVLRRMGMSPASKGDIVSGKLLGRMMVGAVQISALLVIARVLFGISLGSDIVALVLLMLAFAFCCGSFSILFGSFFSNPDQVIGVAVITSLVMSALGGCWWPLEVVSRPFRIVAMCLPTGWAMDGTHKLISFGYRLPSVMPHILVLFSFGLVFVSIASRRLNWDK